MWVAGNAHVEGFDPATGKRVHSYSINGAWALRFADGALYVASSPTGYVRKVDAQTGRVLWRTQLQPWINDILVSGGSLWAVLGADATVHQLALNDGRDLATIPTGPPNSDPQTITAGDGALWVDNPRNGTVARIDPVDPRRRPQSFPTGHAAAGLVEQDGKVFVGLFAGPGDDLKGVTGDVLRVGMREDWLDQPDPALAWSRALWQLEYATLAKLYNYPDRAGSAGGVLVPELATAMPELSDGDRTARITVRDGVPVLPALRQAGHRRDGAHVDRAGAFARDLAAADTGGRLPDRSGRRRRIRGGQGGSRQRHLRRRQHADAALHLAASRHRRPPGDAVLRRRPRRHAVGALDTAPPSAGPYYITTHNWYVVVKRNPNYGGDRPQRLDAMTFEIDVATGVAANRVAAGTLDMVSEQPPDTGAISAAGEIAKHYGKAQAGRPRWQLTPTNGLSFYLLNITRPPFDDLSVRRAVAYAIDRPELAAADQAMPADGYLPEDMPGVTGAHVYPVDGPDLAKARALMHGRTATVVLVTCTSGVCREQAQILRRNLAAIGIALRVRQMENVYDADPDTWDLSARQWILDEYDPRGIIGTPMFDADPGLNPTGYGPAPLRLALDQAEATSGAERADRFGALERRILRTSVPWVTYEQLAAPVFTSGAARLRGCQPGVQRRRPRRALPERLTVADPASGPYRLPMAVVDRPMARTRRVAQPTWARTIAAATLAVVAGPAAAAAVLLVLWSLLHAAGVTPSQSIGETALLDTLPGSNVLWDILGGAVFAGLVVLDALVRIRCVRAVAAVRLPSGWAVLSVLIAPGGWAWLDDRFEALPIMAASIGRDVADRPRRSRGRRRPGGRRSAGGWRSAGWPSPGWAACG